MNRIYIIALAAVGLMSIAAAFLAPMPEAAPVAAAPQAKPKAEEEKVLTLNRDGQGQFTLRIDVNGSEVEFLVDTGADMVALTEEEAANLGILPDEEEFQPTMQTASGTGYAAPVVLDEVEIAGQRLHDVEAVVVKDLGTNLLGQSALRQLGGIELKGDKMVIKAK
ncbi:MULTISPECIES: TIGR02281 family clan AA aspartic protease [unclassified Novosphingobium]|uniref:retropepsin-like aspartic protease family protein n=1 Tax=unclassified Novosphingobium TaxID=2644732 RepID=UPI000ED0CE94|nr:MULTISPECIES: TIGR02281 family clan AA aspartic protease [unclassified Novosphingobium]HCF24044.1 TIGR02281 family clan AA aspartic protease [Novosphingobium sp.]HQV04445.1 TIGR02281 family clan AA aspartic protease [Novosphingobium sp.]